MAASTRRRAPHPSGCARCGAGAGCSATKYQCLHSNDLMEHFRTEFWSFLEPDLGPLCSLAIIMGADCVCGGSVQPADHHELPPRDTPHVGRRHGALLRLHCARPPLSSEYKTVKTRISDSQDQAQPIPMSDHDGSSKNRKDPKLSWSVPLQW